MPEPDGLPDWLSQDELDHYVAEFSRTGFTGGINWYRNMDRNWELTPQLAGAEVTVPVVLHRRRRRPRPHHEPARRARMPGWPTTGAP